MRAYEVDDFADAESRRKPTSCRTTPMCLRAAGSRGSASNSRAAPESGRRSPSRSAIAVDFRHRWGRESRVSPSSQLQIDVGERDRAAVGLGRRDEAGDALCAKQGGGTS